MDRSRRQRIVAGVVTNVCVAFVTLSALEVGYGVFVVTDTLGTFNTVVREAAGTRMANASALQSRGNQGIQLCMLAKMSYRSAVVLGELSHTATSFLLSGSLVGIMIFWCARRLERVDATVAVMPSARS